MVFHPSVLLRASGDAIGDFLLHLFHRLPWWEGNSATHDAACRDTAETRGIAAGNMGDHDIGGAPDNAFNARVMHARAARLVKRIKRRLHQHRLVQSIHGKMSKGSMPGFLRVRPASRNGHTEI